MPIVAAIPENERSKQVIRVGYDLATAYGDTLIALHVVPDGEYESHEAEVKEIPEFEDFSFTQGEDTAMKFARKFVRETLDDVNMEIVEPKGRIGNVSNEIIAEAEEVDARFLVISGRRRSPTGKALFGNTSQQILLNASCPVVSQLTDY